MSKPRKLGLVGKALVALMLVVTAGLGAGAGVAIRAKGIEDEKRASTNYTMRSYRLAMFRGLGRAILADANDRPGQKALRVATPVIQILFDDDLMDRLHDGRAILDAWGNPIYYRCPGPVHKNGWDLISCGPNGVFEEGGGDDLVLGEDLPGGVAAIESGR